MKHLGFQLFLITSWYITIFILILSLSVGWDSQEWAKDMGSLFSWNLFFFFTFSLGIFAPLVCHGWCEAVYDRPDSQLPNNTHMTISATEWLHMWNLTRNYKQLSSSSLLGAYTHRRASLTWAAYENVCAATAGYNNN